MNSDQASATLLSVTQSVAVFTTLLPPLSEVRKSRGNADTVNDVRMGELAASALVVSIGLMASTMTNSPVPAMVAILSAAGLIVMYESVLSATPKEAIA